MIVGRRARADTIVIPVVLNEFVTTTIVAGSSVQWQNLCCGTMTITFLPLFPPEFNVTASLGALTPPLMFNVDGTFQWQLSAFPTLTNGVLIVQTGPTPSPAPVPEAGTMPLLTTGLIVALARFCRKSLA